MTSDLVASCPECGTDILHSNLMKREGGVVIYQCSRCGYLQQVEELYAPETPLDPSPRKTVKVRWRSGSPSPHEVSSLRQLVPTYSAIPLIELTKKLQHGELDLGEFEDWEAQELVGRGRELGLDVLAC
jgi:DNA-directed RNA polymerase subunit RPC12/RpoP